MSQIPKVSHFSFLGILSVVLYFFAHSILLLFYHRSVTSLQFSQVMIHITVFHSLCSLKSELCHCSLSDLQVSWDRKQSPRQLSETLQTNSNQLLLSWYKKSRIKPPDYVVLSQKKGGAKWLIITRNFPPFLTWLFCDHIFVLFL